MPRPRVVSTTPESEANGPDKDGVFIDLVREAMKTDLGSFTTWEPKDKNAFYANCIKFIAVTNKLRGEEGSFFDE